MDRNNLNVIKNFKHNTIIGHEYVDLGLCSGQRWAACNVGAISPEEYGDYFSWGELETKVRGSAQLFVFFEL